MIYMMYFLTWFIFNLTLQFHLMHTATFPRLYLPHLPPFLYLISTIVSPSSCTCSLAMQNSILAALWLFYHASCLSSNTTYSEKFLCLTYLKEIYPKHPVLIILGYLFIFLINTITIENYFLNEPIYSLSGLRSQNVSFWE